MDTSLSHARPVDYDEPGMPANRDQGTFGDIRVSDLGGSYRALTR